MSKIARIVPPNQRVMSRFTSYFVQSTSMNLTPLFEWGVKMLNLLDKNELTNDEQKALLPLITMRDFIFDTNQVLACLNSIQKLLKKNGFNKTSYKEAMSKFSNLKSDNSLKISKQLDVYFTELASKAGEKTLCCSSDIIESCFGKYKEIAKGNKSVGISDLCLCISALIGGLTSEKTKEAMENVATNGIKEWKGKNGSKTLFAEKVELNKKNGRKYFKKE